MDFIFRILIIIVLILDFIFHPVFWIFSLKVVKKVPKINNKILLLSANELARMIRKKEVSSECIVQTYINRIKEINPIINAVVEDRFGDAIKEAMYVDYYISLNVLSEEQLERFKPFFGVPLTVKESAGLKGLSQAVGHLKNVGRKAIEDGESIKRLKLAGCIPLLVSTAPELCIGLETINLITGITRNPYNTNLTCGGSSGGEGALLGSGSSVIGIGSDFAGSVRIPAMFNGVFGHKASPKIIPRKGHYPESTDDIADEYFSMGPMARHASDLRPLLKIMAGENAFLLNLNEKVNIGHLNVFYTNDHIFGAPIQSEIKEGIYNAANYLACSYKITASVVSFPELTDAIEMGLSIFFEMKDIPNFLENPNNPKKNLSLTWQIIKCIFKQSSMSFLLLMFIFVHKYNGFIPKSRFPFHFKNMQKLKKDFINRLGNNGVFLYPTFPTSAFEHYHVLTKPFGISYSMIFNLLGCPSTQVPIGFDRNKMPIGIQVIAAPNQDRLCLAVAEELEKCFGGWVPPN